MVHWEESINSGYQHAGGYVRIGANRTGLTRSYMWTDVWGEESPAEMIVLKDPGYFVSCKQIGDPFKRYQCLKNWSQNSLGVVCDDGGCYGTGC